MVAISKSYGPYFTDPLLMHKFQGSNGGLSLKGLATMRLVSAAEFWTAGIAVSGVDDDTGFTADTYKSVLSVTLSANQYGIVSHIIGPAGLAGTPTTTMEITVDGGTAIERTLTATTTGKRMVLGPEITGGAATGATFTTAGDYLDRADSINAAKDFQVLNSNYTYIPDWGFIRMFGTPCLLFSRSILIRIKSTETNNTATNQERRCGVQYMVLK